jgi:hypothetical protein
METGPLIAGCGKRNIPKRLNIELPRLPSRYCYVVASDPIRLSASEEYDR